MTATCISIVLLTVTATPNATPHALADSEAKPDPKSAQVTGRFVIPANDSPVAGMTLKVILFEYDPRLADVSANALDTVLVKEVKHTKGKATVVKFVVGKGKRIKDNRNYYLSVRGYVGDKYTYYGKPNQGGIGRVLTDGHPRKVEYTGKRQK